MPKAKTGFELDKLPIFSSQSEFVFQITPEQYDDIRLIFKKMNSEIGSDYAFRYDLLRNYVLELIHYGQKLKPVEPSLHGVNASSRIFSLFSELLERQFPSQHTARVLQLRTAKGFADSLKVDVTHLNKG